MNNETNYAFWFNLPAHRPIHGQMPTEVRLLACSFDHSSRVFCMAAVIYFPINIMKTKVTEKSKKNRVYIIFRKVDQLVASYHVHIVLFLANVWLPYTFFCCHFHRASIQFLYIFGYFFFWSIFSLHGEWQRIYYYFCINSENRAHLKRKKVSVSDWMVEWNIINHNHISSRK